MAVTRPPTGSRPSGVRPFGNLPSGTADGPKLEEFNARRLAEAIEQETVRAQVMGWTKITIHMDLADALRLATTLRKRA